MTFVLRCVTLSSDAVGALRRRARTVTALCMVLVLAGCDSGSNYAGDGKLVDNGFFAATDRYVLDLGPLPLRQQAAKKYKLEGLPSTSFVVGIEIRPATSDLDTLERKPIDALVSLALKGQDGKSIFGADSSLSAWTWNLPSTGEYAFVYIRGEPGTYFTPMPNLKYELTVDVRRPDSGTLKYEARLLAKSGGWK